MSLTRTKRAVRRMVRRTERVPDGRHPWLARSIDLLDPENDLNFRHFRMRHMVAELLRRGLPPGSEAPDFDLPAVAGGSVRLSDQRGRPVLLHLVSYTCPVTRGGMSTMMELYRRYGDRVSFVEVVVRQAHPGELHGAYRSDREKAEDARAYASEERVPWPVLVDDLHGAVQRAYGGSAAAAYLIDAQGIIAFCGTWGQSPALRAAIDELLARGGVGAPAGKGTDVRPHLAAAIVAGLGGPQRGGNQALIDLELGFPGANALMAIGGAARPALAPLALRTTPLIHGRPRPAEPPVRQTGASARRGTGSRSTGAPRARRAARSARPRPAG